MKLKKLKKFVSVAIICTMISAMFVPNLSAQAAEMKAISEAVDNYTDVENSEYRITGVNRDDYSIYVDYSVPTDCKMIMAVYDAAMGRLTSLDYNSINASTDGRTDFYFSGYSNSRCTYKLFIVDNQNRPLGKTYSEDVVIDDRFESPSFWHQLNAEPHPTAPLKNDSGRFGYNTLWSVNTDGVLTLVGDGSTFYSAENVTPWDEYRNSITSVVFKSSGCYDLSGTLFQGLDKVKEITLPPVYYISGELIKDMKSLETVYISGETQRINSGFCVNCPNLKNIVVYSPSEYLDSRL